MQISKVWSLKQTKPNQWWSNVKRIASMTPASGFHDLLSKLRILGADSLLPPELESLINNVFLEPMQGFQPLNSSLPAVIELSDVLRVSESDVLKALDKLSPTKSPGLDSIPNWLLRKYTEILVCPITTILNSSFIEQRLPQSWKLVNIVPIRKQ